MSYTPEEVRKIAEPGTWMRTKEYEMLLSYAALLEAMESFYYGKDRVVLEDLRQRAAEILKKEQR